MWLPDKLYEFLPYLYGVAGLATLYTFDNLLGFGSGILLLFTAGLIWLMRRDYRQHSRAARKY